VNLVELAASYGTPFFVYDLDVVRARLRAAREAFGCELYYAVKANPALVADLAPLVDGFDVASSGELALARRHVDDARITFAGPGKTDRDLALARGATVVVESLSELERVAPDTPVMLRMNPPLVVRAFAVSAAGGPSPFGIDSEDLDRALAIRSSISGLHVHAGSSCPSARAYMTHVGQVLDLAERMAPLQRICFGGGLGEEIDIAALGASMSRALDRFCAALGVARPACSLELGRWLVAGAGTYVARVASTKLSRGTRFAILDGGMNHLFSATGLLGNPPLAVSSPTASGESERVTVVGPLCTPLDTLARDVPLPPLARGDLLAFAGAGAYGATLSPAGFLGHRTALELVHDASEIRVARERRSDYEEP